jgi:hypothetical protein
VKHKTMSFLDLPPKLLFRNHITQVQLNWSGQWVSLTLLSFKWAPFKTMMNDQHLFYLIPTYNPFSVLGNEFLVLTISKHYQQNIVTIVKTSTRNDFCCQTCTSQLEWLFFWIPFAPIGVPISPSSHAWPFARPPIDRCEKCPVHMCVESPLNTSPNPSGVISYVLEPLDNFSKYPLFRPKIA